MPARPSRARAAARPRRRCRASQQLEIGICDRCWNFSRLAGLRLREQEHLASHQPVNPALRLGMRRAQSHVHSCLHS
jgi:hypothetical protein